MTVELRTYYDYYELHHPTEVPTATSSWRWVQAAHGTSALSDDYSIHNMYS
jgi:hypothetical protein